MKSTKGLFFYSILFYYRTLEYLIFRIYLQSPYIQ